MFGEKKLSRKPSETQEQLMSKLIGSVSDSNFKAVSFRLEDVLIMTPFLQKNCLFMFMEEDYSMFDVSGKKSFTELRTAAEEAAEKKYGVRTKVTLEKVYDIFAKLSKISPEGKNRLMERECELIEHFSFPRECGKTLFREAKRSKKRVIIYSESVYPRETIQAILENCGYSTYDGLVILSELKDADARSWYAPVLEKSGASANKLINCGSDVAFDVELSIMKGSKALLIAPAIQLMERSGRIAGFIKEKILYNSDSSEYLAIQCILGLYSAYCFDIPQNKTPLSDICGDGKALGFLVLGAYRLCSDKPELSPRARLIIEALNSDKKALEGADDFEMLLDEHFGETLKKFGTKGCELPLKFLEGYCSASDRELFRPYMSADALKKWGASVKEPELVPYSSGADERNSLYRLADKMFPPGTKVRNITEGILAKGRKKKR